MEITWLRGNALRAAWGQRFEAGDQRRKATALRASASSISPFMSGLSTFLTTGAQVASSWYTMDKEGAFANGGKRVKLDPLYAGGGQFQPLDGGYTFGSGFGG